MIKDNYEILSSKPTYPNFTEYDPDSIILYSGLPLKGGGETSCNGDLSDLDKQGIGAFYPKPDTTPSSIDISVKWYPSGQEPHVRSGDMVLTFAALDVSVTVLNSDGELIPKQSVNLSAETGSYSAVVITPTTILMGVSGEAATSKVKVEGADDYITIYAQVPGTNVKKVEFISIPSLPVISPRLAKS